MTMNLLDNNKLIEMVAKGEIPDQYVEHASNIIMKGFTVIDIPILNVVYHINTLTGEQQILLSSVTEDLLNTVEALEGVADSEAGKALLNNYATVLGRIESVTLDGEKISFVEEDELKSFYEHKTKDLFRARLVKGLSNISELVLDTLLNKYSLFITQLYYIINNADLKN